MTFRFICLAYLFLSLFLRFNLLYNIVGGTIFGFSQKSHKIRTSSKLSDTVRTSCLPTFEGPEEPDFVEEKATVTGWGKPSDEANGKSPNLRYYKGVTVIDNTECKRYYGDTAWDGLVCIDTTGSHGVCNVSLLVKNRYIIINRFRSQ